MHTKHRLVALFALTFALVSQLTSVTAARADDTWITAPNLSHVSLDAPGVTKVGSMQKLSTQTSTFTLTYRSSASDAGKFAQVNFFDFSNGLGMALTSSAVASTTGCDQQVLGGNNHSCMFKLDNQGSANIAGVLSGASITSTFRYQLLSGPNIDQTEPATVGFSAPKSTVKAVLSSVRAMAGGAAVVRFQLLDNNLAASAIRVNVSVSGIKEHQSATSLTSDAQGFVWVYVANLKKKLGTTKITATIDGTSTKASASIKWVKGTLAK